MEALCVGSGEMIMTEEDNGEREGGDNKNETGSAFTNATRK